MELFGLLRTFSAADVFQWVSHSAVTGELSFRRADQEKKIYLDQGSIVAVASADPRESFGNYLLCHGMLAEDQLTTALRHCDSIGSRLGGALVDLGYLDARSVSEHLFRHTLDCACDIFLWPDGVFYLTRTSWKARGVELEPQDALQIALEGTRWTDEARRLRAELPHENVGLDRGPEWPGRGLSPFESYLAARVGGSCTLQDLRRAAGGPTFRLLSAVSGLVGQGIVSTDLTPEPPCDGEDETSLLDILLEQAARAKPTAPDGLGMPSVWSMPAPSPRLEG